MVVSRFNWIGQILLVLSGLLPLSAAQPPPGTPILNRATAEYYHTQIQTNVTLTSEVVGVVVQGIGQFALTEEQLLYVEAGSKVYLPHRLSNIGTATNILQLRFNNLSGDDYDLNDLRLYFDKNSNQQLDPGDPEITGGMLISAASINQGSIAGRVQLKPGQSIDLLLTGVVPPGTPPVKTARVEVSAVGEDQLVTINVTDTVITLKPPVVDWTKTASNLNPNPKDEVTFNLRAVVQPGSQLHGWPVVLDGQTRPMVVMRDAIPANTRFVRMGSATGGILLYHWYGDPEHAYRSRAPADLSQVDAVGLGYESVLDNSPREMSFVVQINTTANGTIVNQARLYYFDRINVPPTIQDSNPVELKVAGLPPLIRYFQNANFRDETFAATLGSHLYVQADASQWNKDPSMVETNWIVITSKLTGDTETFMAVETGPNTGVFRVVEPVPTFNAGGVAGKSGNGKLETLREDTLIAEIRGAGAEHTFTTLYVEPAPVVFNTQNNQGVAGASVRLIDANTGQPAIVYLSDGITPSPNPVLTAPSGLYEFPYVAPGVYYLEVTPPAGYTAKSKVAFTALPRRGFLDASGSYGNNFRITRAGIVKIDYPIDPIPINTDASLFVQKSASHQLVEIGDIIEYTVKIKNVGNAPLASVSLVDQLPAGFFYMKGTARLERKQIPDPVGQSGPRLTFAVGSIAENATVTLLYQARIGAGALQGDGINLAQASAVGPPAVRSNLASAAVKVQSGVFTEKGVIVGKVFVDNNRNRIQDPEELGIPGVRIYLEDGTFAITDSEGKYSFYGLRPITHVAKLDSTTLPKGAEMEVLSTRNAGDGNSQFVDLKFGELHKANFAEGSATPDIIRQVKERRAKGEVIVAEIEKSVKEKLTPDGVPILVGDPKAMPASGVVGGQGGAASAKDAGSGYKSLSADTASTRSTPMADSNARRSSNSVARLASSSNIATNENVGNAQPNFTPVLPSDTLNSRNSDLPTTPTTYVPKMNLEHAVTNLDNTLDFIGLKDKDTLPMAQTAIRFKGRMGSKFVLKVNGEEVPKSRMGKAVSLAERDLEAREFIGINLKAGSNTLEIQQYDPFGNLRGQRTITVVAPDKLGQIKIILPKQEPAADGVTPVKIKVRLQDAKGVPVTARTPLTLEASAGRWQVDDLDKRENGVQVFIEGGSAEYILLPPQEPGDCRLVISSGAIKSETTLAFLPDLRPMLAVGVIEGTINISRLNASALVPARSKDGFEEELRRFSVSGNDDKARAAGRTAFFLKGKIKGDYLLTAGFDSEKATRERLFRDIQPDEFYPVYGDSSVRGFDAQSTGRLYVRIDKKRSYLLYGDFNTQTMNEARGLGNYNRSLTGVREHYEKKNLSVNLWASQDSTRQVIEELPANGTSGPYYFRTSDGVVNSEQVEILTRDRHQPSLILKTVQMMRFVDYEFEPFTGRILFKAPVPSLDANLNPISIRVTYEVDQGGDKFWVYGADGQVKVTERVELGGSAVRDENPRGNYELRSGNMTLKLAPKTYLLGEVAQSDAAGVGMGNAGRMELRHQGAKTDARIYWGKAENTFSNSAAILNAGRVESGAKITQKLNDKTRLVVQGLETEESITGGNRKGVRADIERTLPHDIRIEVGARASTETVQPAGPSTVGATPNDVTSLRTKMTVPVPKLKGASIYGEYENDVVETDKRLVAVGGEYKISSKSRLYARHEFMDALGGPFELNAFQHQNTTVFGLDTEYMKDGQLFNEYRARSAFAGREAESATGLRNLWTLDEGVRLHTSAERVTPVTGGKQNESTSLAAGIEYTRNSLWKGTARIEVRSSTPNDSLLNTLGYARKLNRDWTFLSKTIFYVVDNKGKDTGDKYQGRILTGFAWRQTDIDKWNGLAKHEYKYEDDHTRPTGGRQRHVNILSLDGNYQPNKDWIFSGHYAGKAVLEDSLLRDGDLYTAHLVGTRISYELTRRWDVSLNANTLIDGETGSQQYACGPEIGFLVKNSLRIGLGFNVIGFKDEDLAENGYTNPGFFINMRLKFDETLFGLGNNTKERDNR